MKKNLFRFCVLILVFFAYLCENGYSQQKELCLWNSIVVETGLLQNFDLEMGLGNRLKNNLSQRDETYADMGLGYFSGVFSTQFLYRFINNKLEYESGYSHRYAWQLHAKPEWRNIELDFRLRLQALYFSSKYTDEIVEPESFLRNRFKVKFDIPESSFKPAISYEMFYRVNQYSVNRIERQRYTLSLDYQINNINSLEASFILHETVNMTEPLARYVIGLEYKLDI